MLSLRVFLLCFQQYQTLEFGCRDNEYTHTISIVRKTIACFKTHPKHFWSRSFIVFNGPLVHRNLHVDHVCFPLLCLALFIRPINWSTIALWLIKFKQTLGYVNLHASKYQPVRPTKCICLRAPLSRMTWRQFVNAYCLFHLNCALVCFCLNDWSSSAQYLKKMAYWYSTISPTMNKSIIFINAWLSASEALSQGKKMRMKCTNCLALSLSFSFFLFFKLSLFFF